MKKMRIMTNWKNEWTQNIIFNNYLFYTCSMRYMKPVSRAIFCLPKSICECAHATSHIYRQEPWLSTAKALKFVLLVFCSGKLKFSKNPASNNLQSRV